MWHLEVVNKQEKKWLDGNSNREGISWSNMGGVPNLNLVIKIIEVKVNWLCLCLKM